MIVIIRKIQARYPDPPTLLSHRLKTPPTPSFPDLQGLRSHRRGQASREEAIDLTTIGNDGWFMTFHDGRNIGQNPQYNRSRV